MRSWLAWRLCTCSRLSTARWKAARARDGVARWPAATRARTWCPSWASQSTSRSRVVARAAVARPAARSGSPSSTAALARIRSAWAWRTTRPRSAKTSRASLASSLGGRPVPGGEVQGRPLQGDGPHLAGQPGGAERGRGLPQEGQGPLGVAGRAWASAQTTLALATSVAVPQRWQRSMVSSASCRASPWRLRLR